MLLFVTTPLLWGKQRRIDRGRIWSKKRRLKICSASLGDDVVIAIDVGTSGTKVGVYQPTHDRLLNVSRHSHVTYADDNEVTQKPSNWLSAMKAGCIDVFKDVGHITAISVTGQMQDLIGCGNVPGLLNDNAVLYSDARAVNEAAKLSNMTDTHILPTDLLPKLALLPSPSGTDYKLMIGGADYICYELAGCPDRHFTDATTAATTGLTKEPHRTYNAALFEEAQLASFLPLLPEILPRPAIVGHLSSQMAQMLGRPEAAGVPVIHAGGDAFSATVGAGCDGIGSGCYVYGGSSGWVGQTIRVEESEGPGLALAHAANERAIVVAGSVAAVGACVSHACEAFLNCNVNDLDFLASRSEIGASGLVYVPYITGRRCPPADASGALYGLKVTTDRHDIARAVIEGLVFALADASNGMNCNGVEVVGGVAASTVFVQGVQALFGGARLGERNVGVKGAGVIGARALGLDIMSRGKVNYAFAPGEEHRKWTIAFHRWKSVVAHMEGLWNT
ncbi:Carbohydrate kinase FGGY [Gracilaria domingensis]|nr:Carbohydrate kinase FGGY [Gracilaria domingensis]